MGQSGGRTEHQIAVVIGELQRAWLASPHLRLCQLIVNATDRDDPFYVEDDDLMAALNGYRERGPYV